MKFEDFFNKKSILLIAVLAIILICLTMIASTWMPKTSVPSSLHPLGFSVYENYSTLLPIYEVLYSNANSSDLLIDDAWTPQGEEYVDHWGVPEAFPRMILANNVSELASSTFSEAERFNFGTHDYIAYDAEDWNLTPVFEQNNQAAYMQEACNAVHAKGYLFAYTPEVDVPGWGQFQSVNWTCVDFVDLQEQFTSASTSALIKNVTQLLAASKAKNPNLIVFVQLDQAAGSISTLEADILAMSQTSGVNGVIIQDLSTSEPSNSTLIELVNYARSIKAS